MNSIFATDFTQTLYRKNDYSFHVCLYFENRMHKLIRDGSSYEFNPIMFYKPKPVKHREWLRSVSVCLTVEI